MDEFQKHCSTCVVINVLKVMCGDILPIIQFVYVGIEHCVGKYTCTKDEFHMRIWHFYFKLIVYNCMVAIINFTIVGIIHYTHTIADLC